MVEKFHFLYQLTSALIDLQYGDDIEDYPDKDRDEFRQERRNAEIEGYTKDSTNTQDIVLSSGFQEFYYNCVVNQNVEHESMKDHIGKTEDELKTILADVLETGTWNTNLHGDIGELFKKVTDFTIIIDLAFMQSSLRRKEINKKRENTEEEKFYRWSDASDEDKIVEGATVCFERFRSTCRGENQRTFLQDDELKDNKIPDNLKQMKITITRPVGTACGVYIPHMSKVGEGKEYPVGHFKSIYEKVR